MIDREGLRSPWLVIPLMAVGLFLCIKIFQWFSQEVSGIYASKKWPTTSGVVVVSKMRTKKEVRKYQDVIHYTPEVEYKYRIDGIPYTCERVFFGQYSDDRSFAEDMLKRYPAGKQVLVYYDPEDPENAVLEPGAGSLKGLIAGAGIVLIILFLSGQYVRGLVLRQDSAIEEESMTGQ